MSSLFPVQNVIQSKGKLLDLSTPVVMGILNATPNSFYNKGRESEPDKLLAKAGLMLQQGASILDVGGASSKPGEPIMNPEEELLKVIPVVEAIHANFPGTWISVDTYNSSVAKEAINAGASIINDISAGNIDKEMLDTVANLQVPLIAMHMQGTPASMQHNPFYSNVTHEVRAYFANFIRLCNSKGIKDIIIDLGFGFGKTLEHNYQLLRALHSFRLFGKPILVGLSRKSLICKPLALIPEDALNGTTALNTLALGQGAGIIRVHDVREAVEVIRLSKIYNNS